MNGTKGNINVGMNMTISDGKPKQRGEITIVKF